MTDNYVRIKHKHLECLLEEVEQYFFMDGGPHYASDSASVQASCDLGYSILQARKALKIDTSVEEYKEKNSKKTAQLAPLLAVNASLPIVGLINSGERNLL